MVATEAHEIPNDSSIDGDVATSCTACAHPMTAHDQIAIRFCNATIAGRHNRGCVCTAQPVTG